MIRLLEGLVDQVSGEKRQQILDVLRRVKDDDYYADSASEMPMAADPDDRLAEGNEDSDFIDEEMIRHAETRGQDLEQTMERLGESPPRFHEDHELFGFNAGIASWGAEASEQHQQAGTNPLLTTNDPTLYQADDGNRSDPFELPSMGSSQAHYGNYPNQGRET